VRCVIIHFNGKKKYFHRPKTNLQSTEIRGTALDDYVLVPSESIKTSQATIFRFRRTRATRETTKREEKIADMKSPTAQRAHHDLISVLLIGSIVALVTVSGNSDHCKDRKFANAFNTTYMQFTKETVSQEYAIEGEFKNLHCCAKGYRSIEW
jgi:hypothetical protein